MRQALAVAISIAAIAMLSLSVTYTAIPAAIVGAILLISLIFIVIRNRWRQTFAIGLLAIASGATHFDALAPIAVPAKVAGLGLLLAATLIDTWGVKSTRPSGAHKLLVALFGIVAGLAVASILWSEDRSETAIQAASFIAFAVIVYLVSTRRWRDRGVIIGDLHVGYWAVWGALTLGALMATIGWPGAIDNFSGRHQGLFNNPNLLGLVAVIVFFLGVGLAREKRSAVLWLSLLVPLSQVVLSESRTSMLAAAMAGAWVIARTGFRQLAAVGAIAVLATGVSLVFGWQPFSAASFDRFNSGEEGGLLNSRTEAWTFTIDYVAAHPLGIGWGATQPTLEAMNGEGTGVGLSSIHSSYLQLVFELGWVGVVPVCLLLWLLGWVAFRGRLTGIGAGLVAATVAGALIQVTESAVFGVGQPYPYVYWLIVAAAAVGISRAQSGPLEVPRDVPQKQPRAEQPQAAEYPHRHR